MSSSNKFLQGDSRSIQRYKVHFCDLETIENSLLQDSQCEVVIREDDHMAEVSDYKDSCRNWNELAQRLQARIDALSQQNGALLAESKYLKSKNHELQDLAIWLTGFSDEIGDNEYFQSKRHLLGG